MLIGAAFTRFQTLRLQKVFPNTLGDMLISYGSCQFPTLGFVVERFLAIDRFKSEPYWKIKVIDDRDEIAVEFRWSRVRLFEKMPCQIFLDMCLERPEATVEKVICKPKSKWRPLPLDTIVSNCIIILEEKSLSHFVSVIYQLKNHHYRN